LHVAVDHAVLESRVHWRTDAVVAEELEHLNAG
jgi:hypothetical protein